MKKKLYSDRNRKFSGLIKLLKVMKLTVLLLLVSVFGVLASKSYSQSKMLNLSMQDATVKEVLNSIEKQSEFYFLYSENLIDVKRKIDITLVNQKIDQALKLIFKGTDVDYSVADRIIVLTPQEILKKDLEVLAQQKSVSGKVTDSDGQPLPGVTVVVKGTTQGTVTNADGEYTHSNIPEDATLVFSFVGMGTQEIFVTGKAVVDVIMEEEAIGIEEVVAVGYGTMRKGDLTGSIVSLNAEKLRETANTNLSLTLQGTLPGLNIVNTTFEPGSEQTLTIRGENSLTASNSPLIVLDGIAYDGSFNDINPLDVASVSVLKDASSSAIYGARAANGVILITTKKGESGKTKIRYEGSFGVQSIQHKLDMLDPEGYIDLQVEYNRWAGRTSNLDILNLLFANEIPQYQAGTTTDWLGLVFRNAIQQDHTMSISGANEKTSYYSSIGYLDQQGLVVGSKFKRYTIRTNVEHNLNDWLKVGSNLQFTYGDYGGTSPSINSALIMSPYGKFKEDNGEYTLYPIYPEVYYSNPFANIDRTNDDIRRTTLVNMFAELAPKWIPGFSYKLNFGFNQFDTQTGSYYPTTSNTGMGAGGLATITNDKNHRRIIENVLDYKRTIGNHSINFTGLYSREQSKDQYHWLEGRGFVSDGNLYHYMETAEMKNLSSSLSETALESLMGRLNYNYMKKYLLTVTVRRDGYSGFGANNKYGIFPSAALGWVVSQEGFFSNSSSLDFFNYLKFRFSYGVNGNMAIDPYQTLDSYGTANYIYGDNSDTAVGFLNSVIGNPDLKWEGTESFNYAMDFAALDNRISGSVELYKSNSRDLLMSRTVPIMNGYTSILYNIGKTENKGVEILLNTINVKKADFTWSSSFNFSRVRDKIVSLRDGDTDDTANLWFIGQPLQVYYDYNMIGVWQSDDDIANSWQPEAKAGSAKLEDVDKDGAITSDDRKIIDSKLPDWRAGLTNKFTYKNWSLSVFINTVQGINQPNPYIDPSPYLPYKNTNYIDIPFWTPDRPSEKYVSPGYDEYYNVLGHRIYQDASFVRIKDVTLSYDCPKQILETWGINNLRLFISGKNLYTFTKWIGYDPEIPGTRHLGSYPSSRLISVGVKVEL